MSSALNIDMLQRSCDVADRVISGVRPDQMSRASPCSQWTVQQLMEHMVASIDFFADAAEQGAVAEDRGWPDYLPSELPAAHRRHAQRMLAAFRIPGVMDRPMAILAGPSTAAFCIQVAISERYVHAWDLATATDQHFAQADDDIAQALLASADYMAIHEQVRTNMPPPFGPEQHVDPSASPADRLVAFLGRDPHWAGP